MPPGKFCASITGSGSTMNPTSSRAVATDISGQMDTHTKRAAEVRRKKGVCLMRESYLFTSESVSEGHPDKVSDQISDAILDAFLAKDVEPAIADDSRAITRLGWD